MRRLAVVGALCALVLGGCSGGGDEPGPGTVTAPGDDSASEPDSPSAGESPGGDDTKDPTQGPPGRVVDTVAQGLEVPWGLGFLPDGRAVVTERDTREVLLIDPGGKPRTAGVVE